MNPSANYKIAQQGTRKFLVLTGPWTSKIASIMRAEGLTDLRLSHYTNWRDTRIDFLSDLPFLERLTLWAIGIKDVSPLYDLPVLGELSLDVGVPVDLSRFAQLRSLFIAGVRRRVDFTSMPLLERLDLGTWSTKYFSSALECTNLKRLTISRFSGTDLLPFVYLTALETFGLGQPTVVSLAGASEWPSLKHLSLTLANG